jgi:predicted  nucleic acid-binding Zn-ribbon protein
LTNKEQEKNSDKELNLNKLERRERIQTLENKSNYELNSMRNGVIKGRKEMQQISSKNAELVPKFHVALHASHAALPMVLLEISYCTSDFKMRGPGPPG